MENTNVNPRLGIKASGNAAKPLRFHWRLLQRGEHSGVTRAGQAGSMEAGLPDLPAQLDFCRQAEESGIDSLLVDINFAKPEPMMLATALGVKTRAVTFMVAIRSGVVSPTLFAQQVNTLSALTNGRVNLNVVAGHSPDEQRFYGDWLGHDERYARTAEFLEICRGLWKKNGGVNVHGKYLQVEDARINTPFVSPVRSAPEIFIGGNSDQARDLALRYGTCWMRLAETPAKVAGAAGAMLNAGKELGLRLSVICKSTRAEALQAAQELVASAEIKPRNSAEETRFVQESDSQSIRAQYAIAESEWLAPWLWTGAVRTHGAPSIAMVGTPATVASAILEYKRAGVTHFILSGWPKLESMTNFGREVLPLVRRLERQGVAAE
ncbi:MAG TPA: LLM class flavin-dependent oxidoreductase [Candidatus Angelobacter sp.]|nr:LLM class flavin-dependent oxidoreductase [Candidatus Angelobacter sp.]